MADDTCLAAELSDIPFLNAFAQRYPIGFNSQSVQEFYDVFREVSQTRNTFNSYSKSDSAKAEQYYDEHFEDIDNFTYLSVYDDILRSLVNQINAISKDENMTKRDRLDTVKELEKGMTETAREALLLIGKIAD